MTFVCDRCDTEMNRWYGKTITSLDYCADEPDYPRQASNRVGHLCEDCRADLVRFMEVQES